MVLIARTSLAAASTVAFLLCGGGSSFVIRPPNFSGRESLLQALATRDFPRQVESRKNKRTRPGSLGSDPDSVGWLIGNSRGQLLSRDEEVFLGRQVQLASKLTEARRRAAAKLGRVPSADEWAAECGRELVGEALATGASQSEAAPEGLAAALVFSPSPPGALGLWGALGRGRRAKQLLVEANLRLVVKIAGGLSSRRKGGPTLPDAIQEGTLGLVRAAEKFDPELGLRFSTYAFRWITTFVQRAGATDRLIRLPDNVRADLERLFAASVKLGEVLGREPTDLELARELPSGITPEKYRHLRTTHRQTGAVLSLNFMKGGAKQRARMNEGYSLADRVPDDASGAPEARLEAELEAAEMRSHVEWLMEGANLDPKLRKVVELRFGLGGAGGGGSAVREMPHRKVGLELGISRERARQLNKRALQKIKASAGISECPV